MFLSLGFTKILFTESFGIAYELMLLVNRLFRPQATKPKLSQKEHNSKLALSAYSSVFSPQIPDITLLIERALKHYITIPSVQI